MITGSRRLGAVGGRHNWSKNIARFANPVSGFWENKRSIFAGAGVAAGITLDCFHLEGR